MGYLESYPSLLIRVFEGAPLNYDYLGGRDKNQLIVNALQDAIAELETQYGSSDMATWLTPVRMQNYGAQGFLPGGPLHPYMNRGTYNQIVEMRAGGSLPNAKNVIPPGQSGFVGFPGIPSPHVADQVVNYASWTYKPVLLTLVAIEARETSREVFYVE
jgi:penicillin amidase